MYDAKCFGELLVATAKDKYAKRPYSTDTVKDGIRLSRVSTKSCTVEIDAKVVQYLTNSGILNSQSNYVRKFAQKEYVTALKRKFGKVTIIQ